MGGMARGDKGGAICSGRSMGMRCLPRALLAVALTCLWVSSVAAGVTGTRAASSSRTRQMLPRYASTRPRSGSGSDSRHSADPVGSQVGGVGAAPGAEGGGRRINDQSTTMGPGGGGVHNPPLEGFYLSVPLSSTQTGRYLVDVDLGNGTTGRQVARLVLDTGSGDLVVFSSDFCNRTALVATPRPCYDPSKSASFLWNTDSTQGKRINSNCQIDLEGHKGTFCREALLIDGYKAEVLCEMGYEKVGVGGGGGVVSDVCVVDDKVTPPFKMRYWNRTQGTVGMFYQTCQPGKSAVECETPLPPLAQSVPAEHRYYFTLDLRSLGGGSFLHWGEPSQGWGSMMRWSETQPVSLKGREWASSLPYAFHTFEIFDLSLCGVNMFERYSSHWPAMVDTGAACLSLPQEFFDMVIAWVPSLDCVPETEPDYDYSECLDQQCTKFKPVTVCYLRDGADPSNLPTLTFSMSEGSQPLYLPLSGLIVNDRPSGRPRVCINPGDSISYLDTIPESSAGSVVFFPKISFGTLALSNLLTAFDMRSMSIGMRNKMEYRGGGASALCATRTVCKGGQTWYGPLNSCVPPPCDQLYFHQVNEANDHCELQPSFLFCILLTLFTFMFAEIALSEIYSTLATKLQARYALST